MTLRLGSGKLRVSGKVLFYRYFQTFKEVIRLVDHLHTGPFDNVAVDAPEVVESSRALLRIRHFVG